VKEFGEHWRATFPIDELFEVVVDSSHVGMRKPEPEIYRVALDRLGVPAFDALFVDDRAENIDTARELGLRTLLFTGDVHALRAITLI
jgi:putative hydrolase of the HAD superfamily